MVGMHGSLDEQGSDPRGPSGETWELYLEGIKEP